MREDSLAEEIVEIYEAFHEGMPFRDFHEALRETYAIDVGYRRMRQILREAGH